MGNDGRELDLATVHIISIHVPSWGTTMVNFNATQVGLISIHVPSWGTTTKPLKDVVEELFQSTFPRGERHTVIDTYKRFKDFNPRSLVGNDGHGKCTHTCIHHFNPRSLVGNDIYDTA